MYFRKAHTSAVNEPDQTPAGDVIDRPIDCRDGGDASRVAVERPAPRPSAIAALAGGALAVAVIGAVSAAQPTEPGSHITPAAHGCSPHERREALEAMQSEVLQAAPTDLASFASALEPGGSLEGWGLSHGYVVLSTAGAVAIDNLQAAPPLPPLLLYEPSPESRPRDWLDFDGPDDPYRLIGWAYLAPYTFGSEPPQRRCIAASEWFVHEAGWHLKDGGMHLTPGATTEPPRPADLAVHMWHPRVWDLHVWRGDHGVPTVSFANPRERRGGKVLPKDAFFHFLGGPGRAPRGRESADGGS